MNDNKEGPSTPISSSGNKKRWSKQAASDMNFCGAIRQLPISSSGSSVSGNFVPIPGERPRVDPSTVGDNLPCHVNTTGHGLGESKDQDTLSTTLSTNESDVVLANDHKNIQRSKCHECDPNSSVKHMMKSTRIRIANLCCAGEESIIMNTLNIFKGIESVKINIIGRYIMVKHCPEECCASSVKMVEKLCDARLGASIQEAGDSQDDEEYSGPSFWKIIHGCIVTAIFMWAVIADVHYGFKKTAFFIYLANVLIGAAPILKKALESMFIQRTLKIQTLMIVAIAGAMGAGDFHDAGIVVTLFIIAELLEEYILGLVRKAISSSARGLVKSATLVNGNQQVPIDTLVVGDCISVCAGDVIPIDGEVYRGQGVVDESALTGEATPIAKLTGCTVISGAVLQNGYLEVAVSVEPKDSTLRRMNQAVEEVQADRGIFATLVDKFAEYWTPAVLTIACLFCVIGGGVSGKWDLYLKRTLVLLVLACPCAVVLAAPIACVCGIAGASKHGVLIKGSSVIEKLGLVDVVAIDKTGTLTRGFFSLLESINLVTPDVALERQKLKIPKYNTLQLAAALEAKSAHPLANAIVAGFCGCIAEMQPDSLPEVADVEVLDGLGLVGSAILADGEIVRVCVGNERLFDVNGGPCKLSQQQISLIDTFAEKYRSSTVVVVAIDDRLELAIALGDTIRPQSRVFCSGLKSLACSIAMLTGDHKDVADATCEILQIPECESRLLPDGKYAWVNEKQEQGKTVMMIGDGINDTTALAAASVGVAMGAGGSAMAVAVADIVLMSENLLRIPASVQLGRLVRAIIIENITLSVAMKIVAVVLALLGMLDLWEAVLFDIGSLLLVITNGCRPLNCKNIFDQYAMPDEKGQLQKVAHLNSDIETPALLSSEFSPFKGHVLPRPSVRSKTTFMNQNVAGYRGSSFSSLLITEETGVVEIIADRESRMRGLNMTHGRPGIKTFDMEVS